MIKWEVNIILIFHKFTIFAFFGLTNIKICQKMINIKLWKKILKYSYSSNHLF